MKTLPLLIVLVVLMPSCEQTLTHTELLEKTIKYHDPNSNWATFNGKLSITSKIPEKTSRYSDIEINLPNEFFKVITRRDSIITQMTVNKNHCDFALNNSKIISEEDIRKYNLICDRVHLYKDYYTYLYGLPMKLKDVGTNIHPKIEKKNFKGKDYLVLKVTYHEKVGNNIWYFYFNPKTYAMEVYQFYKTDDSGNKKNDSGEYILLTEEKLVNGIKMPKNRAWYYNKNDKLLGVDILN
ncbi:hypothetical protein E1J38_013000 [Seonamhaeicola sediminis]|uniref:Uncharacterized protein n=1 Tax=Seonamhaeicola sediminis TaxID=2528206 RepID=A0A562YB78_9FLAO|nr:DUF6503 family protein [Seonamhaeicola sediminis]TWO31542.1 hypothetical protein E1J38_013000 [Seonamhaeicola sediminis]